MDAIGFSTGAVAQSDLHRALYLLAGSGTDALELSALRAHELGPLLRELPRLDLRPYRYVSVHAPSAFAPADEPAIARLLLPLARRGCVIVLHPDTITDFGLWAPFGDRLCIENMDARKALGRTVPELHAVFARLPQASFCLDVAHARQCDPSMRLAGRLLEAFGHRLAEVHVSELDAHSRHVRLSAAGVRAYQRIAGRIPPGTPVIIEAPVQAHEIAPELQASLEALGRLVAVPCAA